MSLVDRNTSFEDRVQMRQRGQDLHRVFQNSSIDRNLFRRHGNRSRHDGWHGNGTITTRCWKRIGQPTPKRRVSQKKRKTFQSCQLQIVKIIQPYSPSNTIKLKSNCHQPNRSGKPS